MIQIGSLRCRGEDYCPLQHVTCLFLCFLMSPPSPVSMPAVCMYIISGNGSPPPTCPLPHLISNITPGLSQGYFLGTRGPWKSGPQEARQEAIVFRGTYWNELASARHCIVLLCLLMP